MGNPSKWSAELAKLKSIIEKTGLEKTLKWGAEVYTYNGKNVVSYGGFKSYFALWFYNGVFLNDPHKVLMNAQEGKTKALRQWRFYNAGDIKEKIILDYIHEATQNEKAGKSWKPVKAGMPEIPEEMNMAFNKNRKLQAAFMLLTPFKQKEYVEYISLAKREETRLKRMKKISSMILRGTGLNDHYKSDKS